MTGAHPHWKCDKCGAVYVGWGTGGDLCAECDGKIQFFKMPEKWYMGEYYELAELKDEIGIRWREVIVL